MNDPRAEHPAVPSGLLRLVAVDIDGCLSAGEAQPIDLDLLRFIGELNDRSRRDPLVPGITYITGRGAEYVEVILQLTRGTQPAIYECGAAALVPEGYQFLYSPYLDPGAVDHLRRARDLFWAGLGQSKRAYAQPGLELTLSIYPIEPVTLEQCSLEVAAILAPLGQQVMVQQSRTCIDVLPYGSGKANGLRWLSELTAVPVSAMAGIGDSPNDLPWLDLVAYSGAPANSHPEVKRRVDYVSPQPEGRGVRDFLERCLKHNQDLRPSAPQL